jgi:hypothetical protein
MNQVTTFSIATVFLAYSAATSALVVTDSVRSVGCHMDKDMCFFYLANTNVTIPGCAGSNSVRFGVNSASENIHNSEKIYSTLLAAQLANKKVQVSIAEGSCFQGFPTINWIQIQP